MTLNSFQFNAIHPLIYFSLSEEQRQSAGTLLTTIDLINQVCVGHYAVGIYTEQQKSIEKCKL